MKKSLSLIALSGLALSLVLPTRAVQAQTLPPLPIQLEGRPWINPGQPGNRRRGGGSRGGCYEGTPLTTLAYADSVTVEELGVTRTDEAVGSLTTSAVPTLWFYLPTALTETSTEFVIKDAQGQLLYQGQLTGETDESGIVGVPLAVRLPFGNAVQWFLTVDCDEGGDRTTVNGWIESRDPGPDLTRTFAQADARNRVALYTSYGFLHDAMSELAGLRSLNPDDETLAQAWGQFLTSLELGDIADAPVLDCCQLVAADDETDDTPEPVEESEPAEELEPVDSIPAETEPAEVEEDSRSILQRARDRGN